MTYQNPEQTADSTAQWPTRRYHRGRLGPVENAVAGTLVRAGLLPHTYLLTTRGCKTGRRRRNPVMPVVEDGRRWLVAPYGPVPWVRNARAAGRVELTRRGETRAFTVRELPPAEAARVLKRYLQLTRVPRPYFHARPDA